MSSMKRIFHALRETWCLEVQFRKACRKYMRLLKDFIHSFVPGQDGHPHEAIAYVLLSSSPWEIVHISCSMLGPAYVVHIVSFIKQLSHVGIP